MAVAQTPAVLEQCLPDPIASLGVAVALAILCMVFVCTLTWILAGLSETVNTSLPLPGSRQTAASPLLTTRMARLDALDGLRTVLVMYIVIYHVRWALPAILVPWFQQGHWAVQYFFVLSGFVAACSHEANAGTSFIGVHAARRMAVRRITRLCPAYFIALLGVAIVVASRGGGEPFLAWPIQALALQSLLPVRVCGPMDTGHWSQNFLPFSANGEGWFVSAILISSLCFPLIYNALPRGGFRSTLWSLLLILICRSVPTFLIMAQLCSMDMYTFAPVRILEFAAGVLSAQLYRQMKNGSEFGGWDWIFDTSLVLAAVPVWFLSQWHAWAICEGKHGDFFLTGVFCLTCIAARGLAENRSHKNERSDFCTPLSAALSSWALVAPATYTFQAYIYQEIYIDILALLPRPLMLQFWWMPVPLTWAAAVMSVYFVEDPLKRVIEARLAAARRPSLSK